MLGGRIAALVALLSAGTCLISPAWAAPGELTGAVIAIDPGHQLGNSNPRFAGQMAQTRFNGKIVKGCNTTGTATNVGYTITGAPPLIPATNCGPSQIAVTLASTASSITLGATNQPLSGSCTVQSLNVTATGVTIVP